MTANRGMKEFAYYMKPNQKILDILLNYGANNAGDLLPQIMDKAFPRFEKDNFTSTRYITFFKQMCAAKASNKQVLARMRGIKKDVDTILELLESK
jgi:hypothetical protein